LYFEQLKHNTSEAKPKFTNSRKVTNKNNEVNPSEVIAATKIEDNESPIVQMPDEPHRKVIDTSKPVRTVTEK
jgi:hypothetical protein